MKVNILYYAYTKYIFISSVTKMFVVNWKSLYQSKEQ